MKKWQQELESEHRDQVKRILSYIPSLYNDSLPYEEPEDNVGDPYDERQFIKDSPRQC